MTRVPTFAEAQARNARADTRRALGQLAAACAVTVSVVALASCGPADSTIESSAPVSGVERPPVVPATAAAPVFYTTTTVPPTTVPQPVTTAAPAPTPTEVAGTPSAGPGTGIPAVLARIRGCESGDGPNHPGNYHITNGHGRSTSSGAYQFIDSTWLAWRGSSTAPRAYLASPAEQDAAAIRLYNAQGTRPWNASKECWA